MDLDRVAPELRGQMRKASAPGIEHRLGRRLISAGLAVMPSAKVGGVGLEKRSAAGHGVRVHRPHVDRSSAASPVASASPVPPPPSTPVPSPTERAYPSPPPTSIKPGDVAETLVRDVRVRSKPRVTDSEKFEPLLPAGTKLYVLDGPVAGSGYAWFWVAQLTSTELPKGWVAAAGQDGEAWLGPSAFDCPAVPDALQSLVALPRGAGLACFSRVPITFKARLFDCNCDNTPGSDWITPTWLFSWVSRPLIVDPSAVHPPYSRDDPAAQLLLDPKGRFPAKLPIGAFPPDGTPPPVVRITGMFDHPAAETCSWDCHDPLPASALPLNPAVGTCRLEFAVTRIVVP